MTLKGCPCGGNPLNHICDDELVSIAVPRWVAMECGWHHPTLDAEELLKVAAQKAARD